MTVATQWIAPRKAQAAYRSEWQFPGTASIWQRSSQSGVASGTCLVRNPRVAFDWTSEESLLSLDAFPSERAALLLQCRQCLP